MVLLPVTTLLGEQGGARTVYERERQREREKRWGRENHRGEKNGEDERPWNEREKGTETETEMCRLASRWLRRLLVYSSVQPSRPVQPSDQPVFLFIFLTLRRIDLTTRVLSTLLWPRHDGASIARKTRLRCRRTSLGLEKFRRRLVGSMVYSGSWCIVVELLFQFFLIIARAFVYFQKP